MQDQPGGGMEPWPLLLPWSTQGQSTHGEKPSFSVVIAAYQAEATVAHAVRSAQQQTYPPLEVIVCDDGSTDATAEQVRALGASSVRLICQSNRGEAAAKNAAVAAAVGEFVVVLDADDTFMPRRLEALAFLASAYPHLDVLVTDAFLEVDGKVVRRAYHDGWPFETQDQRTEILRRNFILGLSAVRRSRWLEIGGFDEQVALTTDWDFFQRLLHSGSAAGFVDVPLAHYRLTPGSLSSDRIGMARSRVATLDRARARGGLLAHELAALEQALVVERSALLQRQLRRALAERTPDARGFARRICLGRGQALRERSKALAALVSPELAVLWQHRRGPIQALGAGLQTAVTTPRVLLLSRQPAAELVVELERRGCQVLTVLWPDHRLSAGLFVRLATLAAARHDIVLTGGDLELHGRLVAQLGRGRLVLLDGLPIESTAAADRVLERPGQSAQHLTPGHAGTSGELVTAAVITDPSGRPVRRLARHRSLREPVLYLAESGERVLADGLARGAAIAWDVPTVPMEPTGLCRLAQQSGLDAVATMRQVPGHLRLLELGSWTRADAAQRLRRRLLLSVPMRWNEALVGRGPEGLDRLVDGAYWRGVRRAASRQEWSMLTRSYVVLAYHRVAGEMQAGQERLDLRPAVFRRQLRVLRLLGLRPVTVAQIVAATHGGAELPRRGFLLTLDDGYLDAVVAAEQVIPAGPVLFIPTALVGGSAAWANGAPLASWPRLRESAAAGVTVGAHGRRHRPLDGLPPDALNDEVAGCWRDLRSNIPYAAPALAYPNGRHDAQVLDAATTAGFSLAFTTLPGRNGVGTDPWCLRRVGVKDWDGPLELAYKALTGELLPPLWERLAVRRWARTGRSSTGH